MELWALCVSPGSSVVLPPARQCPGDRLCTATAAVWAEQADNPTIGLGSGMAEELCVAPPGAEEGGGAQGAQTQSPSPDQAALINLLSLAKIIKPSVSEKASHPCRAGCWAQLCVQALQTPSRQHPAPAAALPVAAWAGRGFGKTPVRPHLSHRFASPPILWLVCNCPCEQATAPEKHLLLQCLH